MRFLLLFVIPFLVVFVAVIAGGLWLTGNLSADALSQMVQPADEAPAPAASADPMTTLAEELQRQREDLAKQAAELDERAERVQRMEQELAKMRDEVEGLLDNLTALRDGADEQAEARRREVAQTLAEMKPDAAADVLRGMPARDAAKLLLLVQETKDRAKILDALKQPPAGPNTIAANAGTTAEEIIKEMDAPLY